MEFCYPDGESGVEECGRSVGGVWEECGRSVEECGRSVVGVW